jgi:ATP/maltotriose-dependent transcriptional regulator MalT/DNA-binding SARP family transcriptional activator
MDNLLETGKIACPAITRYFPRKRLFRLLDHSRKRPILWISGPPGSGKTILVKSYLKERKLPCICYQVDERDGDIATFFHYMGVAVQKKSPRRKSSLPHFTPEHPPGVPVFAQEFFEDLYARLKAPVVLMFDDYHKAPPDAIFHEVIREGFSRVPSGILFILISRGAPPPPFAILRARQLAEEIGWKDLRMTVEETEEFGRFRASRKRTPATTRFLHRLTDGWLTGLLLLLDKTEMGRIEPQRLKEHLPEEIFDYFGSEVFRKQGRRVQSFLVKTAFFPRMTAGMAERLTGDARAEQILSFLHRNNYFTDKRLHPVPMYEYHSLFRNFLISRAAGEVSGRGITRLKRDVAAILESEGYAEDAGDLYRELRDREGFARVIENGAHELERQGRTRTLSGWLKEVPPDLREKHPWLLFWTGVCRLPSRPAEARRWFEKAFRKFKTSKDRPGMFYAWSGIVDAIVFGAEGLKPLDPWFPVLDRMMGRSGTYPSEEIEARVTCSIMRALALRRPPSYRADEWVERAEAVVRSSSDVRARVWCLIALAYNRFHAGDLHEMAHLLESLRKSIRQPGISPDARLTAGWLEAAHANMNGMHDEALKIVAANLSFAKATGVHLMDLLLMGHGALAALRKGDIVTGKKYLHRMAASLAEAKPWEARFYHCIAAGKAMYRRDMPKALHHSEQSLVLSESVGNPWAVAISHLQRAFVMHKAGEARKAAAQLAAARRMGTDRRMTFIRFACSLAEAYIRLQIKERERAHRLLREGLRIGREKGYANLYILVPGVLETVCSEALDAGIETGYARDLIRKNNLLPGSDQLDVAEWPWPVKVYTLGRFSLLKDGEPIRFSRKVQHKLLAMLKVLIALGGREVPEERLTDILWPDADADIAHNSFAMTLSRLRTLLGSENALQLREGRLTLDNRFCWVDAWTFERLLTAAGIRERQGAGEEEGRQFQSFMEKAVALYKGPFLDGEMGNPWILSPRERLRSRFLQGVESLAGHFERAGEWDKAIRCYRRGLDVDNLAERFYRGLMICHQRQGRIAEAVAVYHQCREALSTAFGVSPSAATETVYRSLRPVSSR